jgi:hypothetical protein
VEQELPSGEREFTPGFCWVRVAQTFVFYVMFCRPFFVPLSLSFCPLCPSIYGFLFGHCVFLFTAFFLAIVSFYLRLSFWSLCLSIYGFLFGHCVLLFTAFFLAIVSLVLSEQRIPVGLL